MSDAGITAGDFDFTGKRVLITGAAGGIGEAMAEAFAAQGATIVAADRNVDGMAALGDRIAVADQIAYDQADASSISEMVERAGDIDILLNNAGILWVGQFEDMPDDEVTMEGCVTAMSRLARHMPDSHLAQVLGGKLDDVTEGRGGRS